MSWRLGWRLATCGGRRRFPPVADALHRLLSEVAGGELAGGDGPQRGDLGAAPRVLPGVWAALVEGAAGRGTRGRRHVARQDDALLPGAGIGHRYGGEQRAGVGV